MTTLATEIKIGQTIKYGNQWGIVLEAPKQSDYKTNEVYILVKTIASVIKRRAYNCRPTPFESIEINFSFRKTTNVKTKN